MEQIVRAYRGAREAADPARERAAHAGRTLRYWWAPDGRLRGYFDLDPEAGVCLVAGIEQAMHGDGQHGTADVSAETFGDDAAAPEHSAGARRADALMCLVNGASGTQPSIVVHVEVDGGARVENGSVISQKALERLACDATVSAVLEQGGLAIGVGRRRRTAPPRLRRALEARDRRCRFPGCHRRTGLHTHHVQHWIRNGPTDPENLLMLCGWHHRLVHEEGFRVSAHGHGGFSFATPEGRTLHERMSAVAPCPGSTTMRRAHEGAGLRIGPETSVPRGGGGTYDLGLTVDGLLCLDQETC
jgi:hypothetical protein